jgi:hypothetical protein
VYRCYSQSSFRENTNLKSNVAVIMLINRSSHAVVMKLKDGQVLHRL